MSKKRPSDPASVLSLVKERSATWWEQRLFKNTYTYKGQLVEVKGWSVKIQYQGQRRTLALKSRLRADAASEASQLFQQIVTDGWNKVLASQNTRQKPSPGGPSATVQLDKNKMTPGYWENRLLQRRYPVPANPGQPAEWAAHIEHEGVSAYFPLGATDTKMAAEKALAIYNTVTAEGWETAFDRYPREVTVGIHWISNPVAWSYTTFHTEMIDRPLRSGKAVELGLRVAIVEADRGVRRALQHWLEASPNIRCIGAYASCDDVLQRTSPSPKELWLVNRTLPGMAGLECIAQIKRVTPALCGAVYAVYEDSNELFLATPGGVPGYMLKRTPPDKLLEPLTSESSHKPLSPMEILFRVRQYFQGPLAFVSAGEPSGALESLTLREKEILQLLSRGYLDKEIASKVGISIWTVHGHMKNIFQKLNVHTRTEAAVKFLQK